MGESGTAGLIKEGSRLSRGAAPSMSRSSSSAALVKSSSKSRSAWRAGSNCFSGFLLLSLLRNAALGACSVDQTKIERLRATLNLPESTEEFFCTYITKEYPLNPNYSQGEFIKWLAVKRPDAPGIKGTFVISISPLYPALEGTVYAFAATPDGRPEEIVPAQQDKRVSIGELYTILTSLFILFCHID